MAAIQETDRAARKRRTVAIIGAASSIGIRPYDDGVQRHLDRAPRALRDSGIAARLGARDLGDVTPPPYVDFSRPPGRVRNEEGVVDYSRGLADVVAAAIGDGSFPVVVGGDCSVVLGCLLGARCRAERIGLAYIDGHADFATPEESRTGSAASMCLALAVGRGDSALARLAPTALVRPQDVVLIGRRDAAEPSYGHAALAVSGILDLPDEGGLWSGGGEALAAPALERIGRADLDGFWIHVDADVLNPDVMPAVDSPEPGGPGIDELAAMIRPLVRHPKALGLEITIYDPRLDDDRSCAKRLVDLLATALGLGRASGDLAAT